MIFDEDRGGTESLLQSIESYLNLLSSRAQTRYKFLYGYIPRNTRSFMHASLHVIKNATSVTHD